MAKNSASGADRRQAAREKARQIAQAQAKREKTAKTILYTGVAVVVAAVLVIVGVLIFQAAQPAVGPNAYTANGSITLVNSGDGQQAVAAKDAEAEDVPEGLPPFAESGLPDTAPVVTVFLDFQCPGCMGFEEANGGTLKKLVDEGTIALEYQPVALLDSSSQGNEYSTRSANLMACVADSGQADTYMDLTTTLFANQPAQGANGMTDEQLLGFAEEAGVDVAAPTAQEGVTVNQCVADTTFGTFVERTTQDALSDGLQGTPRVQINGEDTDAWQDPQGFATEILRAAGEIG